MCDYTGEDLLNVFKELNISLQSLNPNVVKGWFDTDDTDLKKLLAWMCTSLSEENYLSPLESGEFLQLDECLLGPKYQNEVTSIEAEYPGIFDAEMNAMDIELLQDEIQLALEEEKRLDELIKMNEALENEFNSNLSKKTSEEIKTALELKSMQDRCDSLGRKLDEANKKLHKQLIKYGLNLYDFEFGSEPNFINNFDVNEYRDNFHHIASFLSPLLETELQLVNLSENVTVTDVTCRDSVSWNDSTANIVNGMKNRLLCSHQKYVVTKIEVEKSKAMLNYLNKTDIDAVLCLSDDHFSELNREGKEETKRMLCAMLDNTSLKVAEHHIAQTKLKSAQLELDLYQPRFESLKRIEDTLVKYLSQCVLLHMLYVQEKKDIEGSDQFFRKILHYINSDLNSCAIRTEKMNEIIRQYEAYNARDVGKKFKMIKSIVGVLTDEKDFDLFRALEIISEFKTQLDQLENKLFRSDFDTHKSMVQALESNVGILQSFLKCGPTHRIIVVPSELQLVIAKVEESLQKQVASVKASLEISCSMKRIPDKWQNYRRQLWMYFYTNPKKLFVVLQEIEEEFKNKKRNGV